MHAHSNATCRGAMKSHSKKGFSKLRFKKKAYSAVNDTTKYILERKRGFRGAAGDKKYIDILNDNYPNASAGASITHFSQVAQGTGVTQRLGKSFRVTSLQIRGYINWSQGGVLPCRAVNYLVWDNAPNKVLANVDNTGANPGVLDTDDAFSMIARDNASRFKILRKWTYVFQPIIAGNATSGVQDIEEFVKLPDDCVVTLTAADATGAIGDVITGALLFINTGTIGGPTNPITTVTVRVNFQDL